MAAGARARCRGRRKSTPSAVMTGPPNSEASAGPEARRNHVRLREDRGHRRVVIEGEAVHRCRRISVALHPAVHAAPADEVPAWCRGGRHSHGRAALVRRLAVRCDRSAVDRACMQGQRAVDLGVMSLQGGVGVDRDAHRVVRLHRLQGLAVERPADQPEVRARGGAGLRLRGAAAGSSGSTGLSTSPGVYSLTAGLSSCTCTSPGEVEVTA